MIKRFASLAAAASLTLVQTAVMVGGVQTAALATVTDTCTGSAGTGTCGPISLALSTSVQESCSTFAAVNATTTQTIPAYDVIANASAADAGSAVNYTVKCTQGSTTPAFWVDGGLHASSSGTRQLSDGASTAHFLAYNLCDTSACANPPLAIGTSTTNQVSLVGSSTFVSQNQPNGATGTPLKFGFTPVITAGQDVPVGSYSDTVNVNVDW